MARGLADAILVLHVAVVAFAVGGLGAVWFGAWRGWLWVRRRGWRLAHLALVAFVALQAWLGQLCPLTVWEQALRRATGQAVYRESFIEHWLARLLYVEAPWWAFVLAYTLFALAVLATWRWLPPRPRR